MSKTRKAARLKEPSPDKPCSAEGCTRPAACKGLCDMHYQRGYQARRRAQERAEKRAKRLSRSYWAAGEPSGKDTDLAALLPEGAPDGTDKSQAQRIARAEKRNRKIAEERADAAIAVCTELATTMGIERIPHNGGFLFSHGDRKAFLDAGGRLRAVKVEMETVS